MKRLPRRSRGFTLLEVIIVVVIIGVIAMMSLPTIQAGTRQAAVRRSVRAFISAARQASTRAVTTRKPASLIVWPDDAEFGVEGTDARVELPDFADFGDIEGGRAAEGDDEIRFDFYPTGSAAGGSVQIEFTRSDRRQVYTLIIDPLISRVRIEEGE
jgi:prepilin-type N-terminal cleavage/methylation domain-containing protein